MAEYRETHRVTSDSGEKKINATPWLAFFLGAFFYALIAIFSNAQGFYSGPGGRAGIQYQVSCDGCAVTAGGACAREIVCSVLS